MDSFVGILLGLCVSGWFMTVIVMHFKIRVLAEALDIAVKMIADKPVENFKNNVTPFRRD